MRRAGLSYLAGINLCCSALGAGNRLGGWRFEKAPAVLDVLLQDYLEGALGRISLESPQSRAEALERHRIEMEEKARIAAEKAAKKAEEAARGKRGT